MADEYINSRWGDAAHSFVIVSRLIQRNEDGGTVTSEIECHPDDELYGRATSQEFGAVGDYLAPVAALPVPAEISDRQFAQGLATWQGFGATKPITQAEALAWVKAGTLPASMQQFVDNLPSDAAFAANMLLSGATIFNRAHPMVATFGQALGMDSAALDAFWIFCSQL